CPAVETPGASYPKQDFGLLSCSFHFRHCFHFHYFELCFFLQKGSSDSISGQESFWIHADRSSGTCHTAPVFSMLVNIGVHSDGPLARVRISYRRICNIISSGLINTGQASTQALQVVQAWSSSGLILSNRFFPSS